MFFLTLTGLIALALLLIAGMLSVIPRRVQDVITRAPILDGIVSTFTWIPWVAGCVVYGWRGFFAAMLGQIITLTLWCFLHELAHREAAKGPRIVKTLNGVVGRWRNHLALWVTVIALPGFLFIRLIELGVYWMLPVLLGFPKYNHGEWVNCSRQKFEGLIGHDLIWCLYCDWMTGVYSLGAEMLRNVESFWCPIRFYDGKKCENCRTDFPDISGGWVRADGTMQEVTDVLEDKYAKGERSWFGHPARLTVRGKDIDPPQ
jgi:hypothetical protein